MVQAEDGREQKLRRTNIMFYVKERLNDTLEISTQITDENVFCHCPMCGSEVSVG